ncbi:MAG: hypothetical protein COV75_02735 [Candidatus Omnitrophica bacterium CG11_big_fil_rev_8_21_14_0_20_63_9]|nr:MAG: hypothetical protein COV75_02735 [Candidatus Omnitrophica bacterium CG11_big_fil_rev_8_21_14_0_20_63_9]
MLLRCNEAGQGGSGEKEIFLVLSWDVLTRVTTPDRGLIPIQQLQAGQRIYADCVQDQDGRWLARAIEVLPASAPRDIGTGAQAKGAKGGEGG